ncbi:putative bifunctional diguanylate cyclase/phosphodiesterase [Inhella inkyongensis]|uniref:putative bifunctional diguanylate cyclase/phosphodiesterase n=1 Tax=Inhella inkyongensis TaxID=392593 RepID=UPI001585EF02|nr:EAL domain-containing protein [Inhella inkyongensis]
MPRWAGGGFAGLWRLELPSGRLHCAADVAAALGLPIEADLAEFYAVIDSEDRVSVRSAVEAAQAQGGRINRRFKLIGGPAAGQWARLTALATPEALEGALTDLPGEGSRMDHWRDSEQRFRHAFDQTPTTAVQGYDRQRRVIYWNAASEALYGWSRFEAMGRQLEDLIIPPPMRDAVVALHTAWVERDEAIPAAELELLHKDGHAVPVFSSHVMLRNGWGDPEMYCIDVDLRAQRQAAVEGRQREQQLRLISQASRVGWWEWHAETDSLSWSAELGQCFGHPEAGQIQRQALLQALPLESRRQLEGIWQRLNQGMGALDAELRHHGPGGERHFLLHVEAADPEKGQSRTGTLMDITESKDAASRIDRLVHFDPVTGLPNRLLMRERLEEAIARAANMGVKVLVGCLGLDQFRLVNESFGMAAGDTLLNGCAERLRNRLRGQDLVVRLNGDQFGVVLEGVRDAEEAETLGSMLLGLFRQPFSLGDQEHFLGASLGLTLYPEDGEGAEGLMQHAETALHRAKEYGRGLHQFFRAEMNERSLERVQLLNHLRRAMPQRELSLHLQPQVRLSDRTVLGAEALLRWNSAALGPVGPDRFIPLAEETGLIEPIGDWVLAQCCELLQDWQAQGHSRLRLAANLSGRQFRNAELVLRLARELERCGVPGSALEVEVTESVLLEREGRTREMLFALKDLGVSLAIDDFGTGYSSLSYLRRFPVDVLKVDRSFIHDLGQGADHDALVRAIAGMAHALKLTVVAEGVETAEQAAFLTALGCEVGQGWLFGRPVAPAEFKQRYLTPAGGSL